MIRPITCVCFLLACGSGLYLYQSKHRVQVLDREIEQTVHATDTLREQTRVLHAEWTLLNDPQRLQALAEQFLALKTVAPGQFTSMADLENRLPPVRAPEPPAPEPVEVPVAQAPEAVPVGEPQRPVAPIVALAPVVAPAQAAEPAKVASVAAVPPPSRVAERKPSPPRPQIAQIAPPRPESRPIAEARPIIAAAPPRAEPVVQPVTGSMLGMAHGMVAPPPRPMPVNATQWMTPGGGGGGG